MNEEKKQESETNNINTFCGTSNLKIEIPAQGLIENSNNSSSNINFSNKNHSNTKNKNKNINKNTNGSRFSIASLQDWNDSTRKTFKVPVLLKLNSHSTATHTARAASPLATRIDVKKFRTSFSSQTQSKPPAIRCMTPTASNRNAERPKSSTNRVYASKVRLICFCFCFVFFFIIFCFRLSLF